MLRSTQLYIAFTLIVLILIFTYHKKNQAIELFDAFKDVSYHQYQRNCNKFKNYYRIGYENSKKMSWKPTETWDHLRPEFSEAPECFRVDPIYEP